MKIFIFLIILNVLVEASYESVFMYYKKHEYKKAIAEAKISFNEYSNPKLHLIWAKSAEALGRTVEAMSAYERVHILDEKNIQAELALLRIYKSTHRDELLIDTLNYIKEYKLTSKQKEYVKSFKSNAKRSNISTYIKLATGYDTNVNISARGSVLNDYGIAQGEIATLFNSINATFDDVYKFNNTPWSITGKLKTYYQNNIDAHYYDMYIFGAGVDIDYSTPRYSFDIPLSYDRVGYFGVDLLTQLSLAPRFNIGLNKNYMLGLSLKYFKRIYNNAQYESLADNSYGAGTSLQYIFKKNYLFVNIDYEKFVSSKPNHPRYIDKKQTTLYLGMKHDITPLLTSKLSYVYGVSDYKDSIIDINLALSNRKDYNHLLEAKLSYTLSKKYELFTLVKDIRNYSSSSLFSYYKDVVMFGVSANY